MRVAAFSRKAPLLLNVTKPYSVRQTARQGFPAQTFLLYLLIPWLDSLFFGMPLGIFFTQQ
jgi:hypothetical protein